MTEEIKLKHPGGRPTKYKTEYCQRVIEMAADGCSWAECAAEFGVDRASFYRWQEEHEEFRTAVAHAKVLEQAWFEREGRMNLKNREFNSNLWGKSVSARFRDDYTERKETQLTGANGGAIQVEAKRVDTDTLDQEQRDVLRSLLLAAKGKS